MSQRGVTAPDARLQLAYDEGVRAIARQASAVDEIRSRAGTLMAAGAIAAALFGSEAPRVVNERVWPTIAAVGFFFVSASVIFILWPREWRFVRTPKRLLESYVEHPVPFNFNDTLHDVARHIDDDYKHNERRRRRMTAALVVGCGGLAVQVGSWFGMLVLHGGP